MNTAVWIRWKDEWRPGEWVRTIERGKRKGWYVCRLGFQRRKVTVHPDSTKERKTQ